MKGSDVGPGTQGLVNWCVQRGATLIWCAPLWRKQLRGGDELFGGRAGVSGSGTWVRARPRTMGQDRPRHTGSYELHTMFNQDFTCLSIG